MWVEVDVLLKAGRTMIVSVGEIMEEPMSNMVINIFMIIKYYLDVKKQH